MDEHKVEPRDARRFAALWAAETECPPHYAAGLAEMCAYAAAEIGVAYIDAYPQFADL